MSDLVERVAKRTWEATTEGPHRDRAWGEIWRAPEVRRVYEQSARAAIAAVAEWLDAWHKAEYLQSENHASAALRAAAGGGEK